MIGMQKKLFNTRLLTAIVMMAVSGVVWAETFTWDARENTTYAAGTILTTVTGESAPVTITFAKNNASTSPTFRISDKDSNDKYVSFYYANSVSISVGDGYVISGIRIQFHGNISEAVLTPNKGSYSTKKEGSILYGNWMGLFANVVLNNTSTAREITSITVTYQIGTVSVTSAGYATFSSTQQVILGDGVTAYVITGVDAYDVVEEQEISVIPANTGVLLEAAEGNYAIYGAADATAPTITTNCMVAVTDAEINAPVGSYILQMQNGVVGFYPVRNYGEAQVGAGKAYLSLPSGVSSAKQIFFRKEDAMESGVEAIKTSPTGGTRNTYSLSGQKVNGLQQGVNLIQLSDGNTKKILKR